MTGIKYVWGKFKAMEKYRVTLTGAEREELQSLMKQGKNTNTRFKRAQILLGADESEGGKKKRL